MSEPQAETRLRDLEERLRRLEAEHTRHIARQQELFACYQAVLAEQTTEGLVQRVVDTARELTGGRSAASSHGFRDGTFLIGASSRARDVLPCPEGRTFGVERGGVYLDLMGKSATLRLTDEEMRAHPAWWGLPEGHGPLRGLLGARLVDRNGEVVGLILVSDKEGGGEFTAEDEAILGQLAAVASLALQQHQVRQDAERQAGELDAIFDAMADGVVVFGASGTPVKANEAAVAALGFDPVDLAYEDLAGRLTVRDFEGRSVSIDEMTVPRVRAGEHVPARPLVLTTAEGKETFVFASGTPLMGGSPGTGAVVVWHDVTERHQAEQALRESERQQRELARSLEAERARLAAVLESLPVGVWVADPTGRVVEKNEAADKIWAGDVPLSRTIDEYPQYFARDVASGQVLAAADYPMARAVVTGQPVVNQELAIRRFDGTDATILVSATPINDEQGTLLGIVGINIDITDRQQAEAERERLLEENRRQRQIFENWIAAAPVGVAVLRGPDYRFELANPSYQAIPNVPAVPLVGRTVAEVFPEPLARRAQAVYDQVYYSGSPIRVREHPVFSDSPDAPTYWDVDHIPLRASGSEVEGVLILARDVTEQVLARQEVEDLAARNEAVLQSMNDGLVVFDLGGNLLEMNPAALRLHGFATVEEVHRDVREFGPQFDLFHLDGRPIAVDDWPVPRVARGDTYSAFEVRVRNLRTREDRVWSYNGAPVRDRDGNVILGVLTMRDVTRQKEMEAALRRQFVFLEQLINEAPVGIAVVSGPDHRYELVNPAYRDIPGIPDVPMVGCIIAEVFPEVVAKGALGMVEEVYRTHQIVGAREYAASVGPGREDTYFDVYHVPLAGPGGEVERVLILAQEVTDQVRARRQIERAMAELAEERARLEAIVQNAPTAIVLADRQARVLFSNPVADRLWARPVPYGQPYESHAALQLCHPDGTAYDPRDLPLTRSALDGETQHDVEMMIRWPDGQWRDLLVNTAPVRSEDGEILGAVGVFQDNTERNETRRALRRARDELEERVQRRTRELVERSVELQLANESLQRAEEALRRQNEDLMDMQRRIDEERRRYRELFDFAPDGYLLTDQAGAIQEANRAGVKLLGASAADLPGRSLESFVDPADVPALYEHLYELSVDRTSPCVRWEMRLQPQGQASIYAAAAASPSYSTSGQVEGVRWLLRDVTHDKQMQTALVRAEKLAMAGRLAASLAHEINNPLAAAMGSVELVREAFAEAVDPGPLLDVTYASLARAARIVSQLRDAHRHVAPEEKQPADLNDVMENVLLLIGKTATAAGVEIAWQRAKRLPTLPLMVDGIQQVFLNLVLNAVEAMPGGGHLAVRILATERPAWIGVEFANDGPYIPPKVCERLFEPFETTKPKGAGLGLFVSQNIMQQHGGTIEVETAEGQGTTFTVWLPA